MKPKKNKSKNLNSQKPPPKEKPRKSSEEDPTHNKRFEQLLDDAVLGVKKK
jgi:hypothetical protein